MSEKITIYTDGAARGNPGKAGWAVLFIFSKKEVELGGFSFHATNNQMELTAPIEALKYLKKNGIKNGGAVDIFADSKYVILGITEWIFNWQKNDWRNAAKKPVLNKELWRELYDLAQDFNIRWHYVEGHSGDKYNDRVDEIATSFADGNLIELKK